MDIAISVNRVPIRLTDERWSHIVNAHDDLAGYYDDCLQAIEDPDLILPGLRGSLQGREGPWQEPLPGGDLPRVGSR
jgi:hypothetical protein